MKLKAMFIVATLIAVNAIAQTSGSQVNNNQNQPGSKAVTPRTKTLDAPGAMAPLPAAGVPKANYYNENGQFEVATDLGQVVINGTRMADWGAWKISLEPIYFEQTEKEYGSSGGGGGEGPSSDLEKQKKRCKELVLDVCRERAANTQTSMNNGVCNAIPVGGTQIQQNAGLAKRTACILGNAAVYANEYDNACPLKYLSCVVEQW